MCSSSLLDLAFDLLSVDFRLAVTFAYASNLNFLRLSVLELEEATGKTNRQTGVVNPSRTFAYWGEVILVASNRLRYAHSFTYLICEVNCYE